MKQSSNINSSIFENVVKHALRVYFYELGNKNYHGCEEILRIMKSLMANTDKITYQSPGPGDHLFETSSHKVSVPIAMKDICLEKLIMLAKELGESIIDRNETEKPNMFFSESMKLLSEDAKELSLATIFLSRSLPSDVIAAIWSSSVKDLYSSIKCYPWIHHIKEA